MKVTQLCPALCDPMGYTVHGILQARILEWVAFPFSRGSSQPRDRTQVSCTTGRFFTSWATRETLVQGNCLLKNNSKGLIFSKLMRIKILFHNFCFFLISTFFKWKEGRKEGAGRERENLPFLSLWLLCHFSSLSLWFSEGRHAVGVKRKPRVA